MSDLGSKLPTRVDEISGTRQWILSTLLVLLTLVVAVACVIVLSVTLTQTRVAASAGDGGNLGIRRMDYVGRNWAALVLRINDGTVRLVSESTRTADLTASATIADAERKRHAEIIEALLVDFNHRVQTVDPEVFSRINRKGYDVQVNVISDGRDELVAKAAEFGPAIDAIQNAYKRFRTADQEAIGTRARLKANQDSIAAVKEAVKLAEADLDRQFELLKPGLAADKDARARLENVFYELNINNFDGGRGNDRCGLVGGLLNRGLYHLMTLRPDLLTLMLVILMGILGSALQISHAYFMKNQVQTIGGYFQRISVGAMTALVIFIVAKAGVPILADPSRLGGDAPINPYFISFLAIVSGLLSENAIANVQTQGAKLLGGSGDPNRWARRDLTKDLEVKGVGVRQFAGYLGVTEDTATDMVAGKNPLDAQQQKLLSVCLQADPRDLFTDIPPRA
jgi:hypothetical protein